ncbi:tetratricopeptide repeat protein [Marinibaculum pumilum]|uniref:Tetratricopeptide repeat protein n=1 Tax=Marinibaculum pumilum TaxID=1766165 RepID=A0ABV7L797_9PROT
MTAVMGLAVLLPALAFTPAAADETAAATPAPDAAEAETPSRAERLNRLYETLRESGNRATAEQVEQRILTLWAESGSPTADLLLGAGTRLMNDGDLAHAMDLFYAVIELKPDFAEAWNKRATLYYLLEEYELSLADIERVLELEPRHFGALSGRGLIMDELDRKAEAYEAFRRALAVNPFMPGLKSRVEALQPVVRGRKI